MADNDCSDNDDNPNVPPTKPRFGKMQKGKLMLIDHQWYCYTQDGAKGSRAFWKCIKKNSKKCKGRAATIPNAGHKVVYQSNNHNHTSEIIKTQVRLKEQEVVARAVQNPGVPPRRILGQMAMEVGDTAELAAKTTNANLTRQINYQRKKDNQAPGEPSEWSDIEKLPEKFTQTAHGLRFLLLNSIHYNDPGILFFASDWQLNLMDKADSITADGTFSTAPSPFHQLYVIMANFHKNRRNYPVGFAFLPDKTTQTYVQLWTAVSAFVLEPPRAVRVDFESADLKALKEIFPDSIIEGCWFHFRRAIWRNLQAKKLVPVYNAHRSFQLYVKSLLALAFVPTDRVVEYFEILSASKPEARVREIDEFEHYFEATYLGLKWGSHGARKPARYPRPIWNQFNRTLARTDKTTNSAESWNSVWSKGAESSCGLWTVIENLRREEALTQTKYMDHLQRDGPEGTLPQDSRQIKQRESEERFVNLCSRLEDLDPLDYLHTVAQFFEISSD